MSLTTQIDADLKTAMLQKDETARDALRLVKSELLLREVELGHPLTDDEARAVLQKAVKQRRDAIDQFREAGRADIVEKETRELDVVQRYLPKTMDEAETRAAVQALSDELGLTSKKEMGALMKALKTKYPALDGKLASKICGEILQG